MVSVRLGTESRVLSWSWAVSAWTRGRDQAVAKGFLLKYLNRHLASQSLSGSPRAPAISLIFRKAFSHQWVRALSQFPHDDYSKYCLWSWSEKPRIRSPAKTPSNCPQCTETERIRWGNFLVVILNIHFSKDKCKMEYVCKLGKENGRHFLIAVIKPFRFGELWIA